MKALTAAGVYLKHTDGCRTYCNRKVVTSLSLCVCYLAAAHQAVGLPNSQPLQGPWMGALDPPLHTSQGTCLLPRHVEHGTDIFAFLCCITTLATLMPTVLTPTVAAPRTNIVPPAAAIARPNAAAAIRTKHWQQKCCRESDSKSQKLSLSLQQARLWQHCLWPAAADCQLPFRCGGLLSPRCAQQRPGYRGNGTEQSSACAEGAMQAS